MCCTLCSLTFIAFQLMKGYLFCGGGGARVASLSTQRMPADSSHNNPYASLPPFRFFWSDAAS